MESDAIDHIIEEELKMLSQQYSESDSEDTKPEEDLSESNEKLENDVPRPVFSHFEASRDRMKNLEQLILEDLDENDRASSEPSHKINFRELLSELDYSPEEDLLNLKERILSEIDEHVAHPGEADGTSLENVKPTAHVDDETKYDAYKETEKQFIFEWRALEERQRNEEEMRLAQQESEREDHLNHLREVEEKKKRRFEKFEEELKIMDRMSSCKQYEDDEDGPSKQFNLEVVKQQELIKQLDAELEEEKRAFKKVQQEEKRRTEERRCGAAIKLQAAFRGAMVRRWSKNELSRKREEERRKQDEQKEREQRKEMEEKMKKEWEEKRKKAAEEEKRQKEEQERRRTEYERAKEQEHHRLERERRAEEQRRREKKAKRMEDEKRIEEEKRKAMEKMRRRIEDEQRRQIMAEERKEEERRKTIDEERKEEEKGEYEEKERKQKEEEEEKNKQNAEESRELQNERELVREDRSKREEIKDERRKKIEEKSVGEENRNVDMDERKRKEETRRSLKQLDVKLMEGRKQIELEERKSNGEEEQVGKIKKDEENIGKRPITRPISSPGLTAPTYTSTLLAEACLERAEFQFEVKNSKPKTETRGHLCNPTDSVESYTQDSSSACLPESTELKRLAWMMNCIPCSKLSMQRKRKRVITSVKKREARRAFMPTLPPLPSGMILKSGSWGTLAQVTTVTLEDLPGCSLSTLSECTSLQSLTLRRCGIQALEGLTHCRGLKHIDVQENSITFVNLVGLDRLEVLLLGRNQLTSIHGLDGAVNLTVLQLSHNIIFRISGLESLKKLRRLSVDHNQLISTKGLSDAFTLLHLDCSYNHLSHVEGLEHCALLNTLDLRGNSLSGVPILKDHVLLRELYLDDNNITSLHGLDSCWLPLLCCLSVSQNNVTELPLLDDLLSLKTLDVSHNCLSELENICLSLQGCTRLQELNLSDNPVEQENTWRPSILAAKPNLIKLNGEQTGSSVKHAVGATQLWSFQALCQAHQDQLNAVLEKHSMEISMDPTVLDAHLLASKHSAELLCLAEQQRYAHEYSDSSVFDTAPQEVTASGCLQNKSNWDLPTNKRTQQYPAEPETQSQPGAHLPANILDAHLELPEADIPSERAGGHVNPAQQFREQSKACRCATEALRMDLKTLAAMVIQRCWRKYRRTGASEPPVLPKSHGKPSPQRMEGSSERKTRPPNKDYAATVIQAIWRGYALRRRLARALALAQVSEEDEAFEEVDLDEFIFDEEAMENDWMALHSEASLSGLPTYSEQLLRPKPLHTLPELQKNTPELLWKIKQACVGSKGAPSSEWSLSQDSKARIPSPPSSKRLGAPSERLEKILKEWGIKSDSTALLILKRAQKMKGRKQQQRKLLDPTERLTLFRNRSKQHVPVEAHKKCQAEFRDEIKGAVAQGVENTSSQEPKQMQQPGLHQWLHTQAIRSQRGFATSVRDHFLPEIDPEILNGGRVQLLGGTKYRESPDSAARLWPDVTVFSSHFNQQACVRRHSVDPAKKEVPSPKRVTSAPSRKERISFRDNPVQLSGGWGGGKKRAKVNK